MQPPFSMNELVTFCSNVRLRSIASRVDTLGWPADGFSDSFEECVEAVGLSTRITSGWAYLAAQSTADSDVKSRASRSAPAFNRRLTMRGSCASVETA